VEAEPERRWDHRLEPVHVSWRARFVASRRPYPAEAAAYPPAVSVYGENRQLQRVHHHAPGGLLANTRQRCQEPLAFRCWHLLEGCESQPAKGLCDPSGDPRDRPRLLPRQATPRQHCADLLFGSRRQEAESRERLHQRLERLAVQRLIRLDAAEDEEKFLQRVPPVPVGMVAVAPGQGRRHASHVAISGAGHGQQLSRRATRRP